MLTPQQLLQNHLGLVQVISQPYVARNFRYSWAERGRQEPREDRGPHRQGHSRAASCLARRVPTPSPLPAPQR